MVYFFLATKMWRLGKAKGYITPGDMLGDFYKSRPVVFWCAAIGLLAVLPYAVAQLVAIGKTFEALTDGIISYNFGVTVGVDLLSPCTCTSAAPAQSYGPT